MGLFATLNPEQLGRVQRARAAQGPFDIGVCLDAAITALKRDFFNIVLVAGLVSGLGIFACGIGLLATAPLQSLMVQAAYRRLFPATPSA